uniref:Retrotransposon gag domain-containing protein n=1 Tax=Fagus sylvatica TaxID=28930 RepID=A0A2N9F447_FAGSY
MYCETMAPYAGNEPLLIMTFQESLSSHVAAWFLQLEEITHWKGLTVAFLAQYLFNTESTLDYLDLQGMERKSGEALDLGDQGDTIDSHFDANEHSSKNNEESMKRVRRPINRVVIQKANPKEADHHKYKVTKQKGNGETLKARNSHAPHRMIPIQPKLFFLFETKVFLRLSPHHLHDSSKQCEFHFGIPGHSLEDCHALKRRVQDLINHGILRINEGSTPSVIIAWSPEHHKVEVKDGTFIPSLKSQGPTTSDIQPVHLSTLPTHLEARKPTVPKVQPKLTSKKANHPTNKYMTLKRKIQELGRFEPEVLVAVQPRKLNMHTIHTKRIKLTVDSHSLLFLPPRFSRALARKMSTRQPPFKGPYFSNPSLPSLKPKTLRKRVWQAFQGQQDRRKPKLGSTSTVRGKIDRRKETMLKISQFSPGEVTFTQRFFLTRFELIYKSRNFKTQRATLGSPRYSPVWPESRSENGPPTWKNTLVASIPKAISLEPKLYFSQVQNFKEEGIASFPRTPRSLKTDIGSYVNCAWEN